MCYVTKKDIFGSWSKGTKLQKTDPLIIIDILFFCTKIFCHHIFLSFIKDKILKIYVLPMGIIIYASVQLVHRCKYLLYPPFYGLS